MEKKDLEIYELQSRIKKLEQDLKQADEAKKQLSVLKKTHEECRHQIKSGREELNAIKKSNQKLLDHHDQMNEELKPKHELTRDLKSLLTTQDYHDCVLTSSNGQKYQAHKCILAVRSQTLRDLIHKQATQSPPIDPRNKSKSSSSSNMNKQQVNELVNIELNDLDQEMMPFLLNYIYTANTDGINDENVQDVMKLADKYELPTLRAACLLFMENRLNRSTVIPILIEAYELSNDRLKNKCMHYIQDENIDLLSSPQWNSFKNENPKLALSLYERYINEMGGGSNHLDNGSFTSRTNTNIKNSTINLNSNRDHKNNGYH